MEPVQLFVAEEKNRKRPPENKPSDAQGPRKVPKLEVRHLQKALTMAEASEITSGFQVQKKVVRDGKER